MVMAGGMVYDSVLPISTYEWDKLRGIMITRVIQHLMSWMILEKGNYNDGRSIWLDEFLWGI